MENTERVTPEELDELLWQVTDPLLKVIANFVARGDDLPEVLQVALGRSRVTFGQFVATVGLARKFA